MGCHSSKLDGSAPSGMAKTKQQSFNDFLNYESTPHTDQLHGFFSLHHDRLQHRMKVPPGSQFGTTAASVR